METDAIQFNPVALIEGDVANGVILLCDHACNLLPIEYGDLGLPAAEFSRHIAYGIGAAAVVSAVANQLAVPAVMCGFSRLLVDPNRGEDDPTLIMRISDGAIVPGNARVDEAERIRRLNAYYRPYHTAIAQVIDNALSRDVVPILLSIHSFTPVWRDRERPWHGAILWDRDPRIAVPLIEELGRENELLIGDNEPYTGILQNDTLYKHGTERGLAHALIEIRQDLIADEEGVAGWVARLVRVVSKLASRSDLRHIRHFGSHAQV
jgi:predicted N-formylglutamate amidohydrolase